MERKDKYLIFDTVNCWPAGLDHKLSTLKRAITEAIHLDRILVLRKFTLWPYQNFLHGQHPDVNAKNPIVLSDIWIDNDIRHGLKYIKFEDYINLEKTKIYDLQSDNIQEIEKPLHYINEEDFDLSAYTDNPDIVMKTDKLVDESPEKEPTPINNDILIMENNGAISKQQNAQYKIIVRRTNRYGYSVPEISCVVSLYPSDKVEHLTDLALQAMGTSLSSVKKRFSFYYQENTSQIQHNYKIEFSEKYPLYYTGLHVRLNDISYYPHLKYAANTCHIKQLAKQAIPKGSIIYIMSDISNPRYFDFLKKDYTVYQYHDFPELKALVLNDDTQEVDNAMLYSVEKNILQYAHIKIVRTKRRPKLVYLNASFETPLRFRLQRFFEYLSTDLLKVVQYSKIPPIQKLRDDIHKILRGKYPQM